MYKKKYSKPVLDQNMNEWIKVKSIYLSELSAHLEWL